MKELGGSEYITISYIFLSIWRLIRNLTTSTSYTDNELNEYKIKNTLYSALLHYCDLSDDDAFFVCLLDSRCKKLMFATLTQKHQAETALCNKYNEIKSLYKASTSSNKSFSPHKDQDKQERQHQIY
ncbi:16324_t:CDS:2 [Cetraspora pellucida]|uniref:16324_t:CDS:1 n=1 Tax=Cetraspora pellucida TaxID=1433469 RepID=A0ACA9LU20_9GLOM|nr:16324_t:CDS:2 [Cetraspora pellucida]